ncbi:MAG: hypothetical protein ACFBRM_13875 [Pikeienuella sp.]
MRTVHGIVQARFLLRLGMALRTVAGVGIAEPATAGTGAWRTTPVQGAGGREVVASEVRAASRDRILVTCATKRASGAAHPEVRVRFQQGASANFDIAGRPELPGRCRPAGALLP